MAHQQLILNRYRPIAEAGAGGFGTVQVAWDTRIQRKVALNCIELDEFDAMRAQWPDAGTHVRLGADGPPSLAQAGNGRAPGDSPALLRQAAADTVPTLEEFAERLRTGRSPEEKREALLHTMACKAAIKGGWVSDPAELRVLVDRVQSGEIKYCPHGRPVAVKLTKYELEKMFKRA